MNTDYPLDYEPATPEYVFDVLRSIFGPAAEGYGPALEPGTPIEEWFAAWDLDEFHLCGRSPTVRWLCRWWDVEIPWSQWRPVLKNRAQHTVGDVCELIALYARRPVAREAVVLGRPCRAAGMFLAVRSLFARHGLDVARVAPSTGLAPFLRRRHEALDCDLRKLAPAVLPLPTIVPAFFLRVSAAAVWIGMLLLIATLATVTLVPASASWSLFAILAGVSLSLGGAISSFLGSVMTPSTVGYEGIATFRDLAGRLSNPNNA